MRLTPWILAILLTAPAVASAQQFDLGNDVDSYRRFLIYPHLQKGWESMQRGERDSALAEFERARDLAPANAAVALQLAEAYSHFGDDRRAEAVLREQLTRTPDNLRVQVALTALLATRVAAPPATTRGQAATNHSAANHPVAGPSPVAAATLDVPVTVLAPGAARPASSSQGRPAVKAERPAAQTRRTASNTASRTPAVTTPVDAAADARMRFAMAVETRRFDDAHRQADLLLAHSASSVALLDELSYQLLEAGGHEQATRLLLKAYPFAGGSPDERERVLQRLTSLVVQQREVLDGEDLSRLRAPLETPGLRSRQSAMWAELKDCAAVRALLGDMSHDYHHDDMVRLGVCSANEVSVSARAYARAHELQPGGIGSKALAYHSHAAGDYATALGAWRSVPGERLSNGELLGATVTALAAGERGQAAEWLATYRERGGPQEYEYWSLVSQSETGVTAAAAIERAVQFHAQSSDYLRLARLQTDPAAQVRSLETAAELDGTSAQVQKELSYAYVRNGRTADAQRALERAAVLDPADMGVQQQLGYAYWQAGRAPDALRVFERAWRTDHDMAIAEQLVYVHQRLRHNREARWYAEQVLDGPLSAKASSTPTQVDRRFGLMRLHEDLGRRLSMGLDGWSGTRVGTGTSASQAGSSYRSYSQFEVDYRLGKQAVRDGTTISAYARVIADGGDVRSAWPSQNPMLGVGLRWKPLRNQVFYLAGEHQNSLDGDSRRDVLVRASASFLNGGRFGDDWHASGHGWIAQNLYLDLAHYVRGEHSAFTADYRSSVHRKVAASQTVEPYYHLQFNGAHSSEVERDIRAGVGVRWNLWHGAGRYDAARHKLSLGVEFQQALETYLADRNGFFFTLGTRW